MWAAENRGKYSRWGVRYPSDLIDQEWAFIKDLIPPAKRGRRRRKVNLREIVSALLYILARISRHSRLARDFECLARSAVAFIPLAMIKILLIRLALK